MSTQSKKRAVILLSGGLDSATILAIARHQGFDCYTLGVDYGQRHHSELQAAQRVASALGSHRHKLVEMDLRTIGGSALTDDIDVPESPQDGIPITYVPARNTIFLGIALGYAETLKANYLFIGVNAVDYSGYPDCRPDFINAFEQLANLATKAGAEGVCFHIETPLMDMSKAQIIRRGIDLGVDYSMTVSCYQADTEGRACGHCDSCRFRAEGFADAGIADPTAYQ